MYIYTFTHVCLHISISRSITMYTYIHTYDIHIIYIYMYMYIYIYIYKSQACQPRYVTEKVPGQVRPPPVQATNSCRRHHKTLTIKYTEKKSKRGPGLDRANKKDGCRDVDTNATPESLVWGKHLRWVCSQNSRIVTELLHE